MDTRNEAATSVTSPSLADVQTVQTLQTMLFGYRTTQALAVAARLRLADLLADGPLTAEELATAVGADTDAVYRLLRALASIGVFTETAPRRFALTPLADLLRQEHPHSLRATALNFGENTYRAWGDLLYGVTTGKTPFEHIYGMSHWDYLAQHPEANEIFNQSMSGSSQRAAAAIVSAYDFSAAKTVVDVAGGQGVLLAAVLRANPVLHGILFDQEHVVAGAAAYLEGAGVVDRCERMSGDFFASLPPGADLYMLRHIIHDWDDERSIAILRSCVQAMAPDSKTLIIESVIEPGNEPSPAKFLDLVMLVMNGGRERTAEEYERLFTAAGLRLTRIIPAGAESLIEGERA